MIDVLVAVIVYYALSNPVCIDNIMFKIHYQASTFMALRLFAIVISRQYDAEPIDCVVDNATNREFIEMFKQEGSIGIDMSVPITPSDHRVMHPSYYKWVCLVLLFQALLFYIPRHLWKLWEGGRIKNLVMDLIDPTTSDAVKRRRQRFILEYLISNRNNHNLYMVKYFSCECLNLVNVVLQIKLMDALFDYTPTSPCVLPTDNFYKSYYDFHRNCLNYVACASSLTLVYRLVLRAIPYVRMCIILDELPPWNGVRDMKKVCLQCELGDWFMFKLLRKNISGLIFQELLRDFASTLQDGHAE